MNNFVIFVVGIAVTLIVGMGVATSQVFIAYKHLYETDKPKHQKDLEIKATH